MSFENKVAWSEGMFIRAQHFQQDARYVERLVRRRVAAARGFCWGFTDLGISRELLATGRFALTRASGAFEDGTPFAIPEDADHPPPLELPETTRGAIVYLTLPISQPGGTEAAPAELPDQRTRYETVDFDAPDAMAGRSAVATIRIAKPRLRYALETSDRGGLFGLGVARIQEVRADGQVLLDEGYVPPVTDVTAAPPLAAFVTELVGLLGHRAEAIAGRLAAGSAGTGAELLDMLMLQTVNRWQPLMAELSTSSMVHPETVYRALVSLAGELATFTAPGKRPPAFEPYRHDRLQPTFAPVMAALRQALSAVLEETAVPIPLVQHRVGLLVAQVQDRSLFGKYSFVMAAKASMPADLLVRGLAGQLKIGPVEQIRELVNAALPGVRIRSLAAAPRQIPYHTGKAYFELDRSGPLWKAVAASGAMALHVSGDFPGLEIELWAVKE